MGDILTLEEFLSHYGVIGQKWGVRRASNKAARAKLMSKGLSKRQAKGTVRAQNIIDRQRAAAFQTRGEIGVRQMLRSRGISNMNLSLSTIVRHPLSTRNAARTQLQRNTVLQSRIANGEKRVTASLLRLRGVSIADLSFNE